MKLYRSLFRECAKNDLKFWECPSSLFLFLGVLTCGIILFVYFLANIYFSLEIVVFTVSVLAIIMLVINHLVTQTVNKINLAKRQAEIEKEKTKAIITNLADGLIVLSRDCNIVLVNPKAEEYLNIKEKNVLGRNPENYLCQKEFPAFAAISNWCPKKLSKKIFFEETYPNLIQKRYLRIITCPCQDSRGNLLGFIKILYDITREKEIDRMKSEHISLAYHQLHGPLSSLKWLIELLYKEKLGKISTKQRQTLEKMYHNNEEMIRLITELLNISKMEETGIKLKLEKTNIKHLIEKIVEQIKPLALWKNIALDFEKPKEYLETRIDQNKIRMVIQNLIENAIKYTKKGGKVLVKVKKIDKENLINLGAKNLGKFKKWILVLVKDNGIGIPSEDKNKIFSKYFRSKKAQEMTPQGTGLGLYMNKQIIEKHNGKIWFESEEGRGSVFCFALPAG